MKNPYPQNTARWQLFENVLATEQLIIAHTADIARAEARRADAIKKLEDYKETLAALGCKYEPTSL